MTMLELLATDPNYSKFVEAMTAAGIAEPEADAPQTWFVPTNAAFDAADQTILEGFMDNLLPFHTANGVMLAADLAADDNGEIDTTAGEPLTLSSVNVTTPDVEASNRVIPATDPVLALSLITIRRARPAPQ